MNTNLVSELNKEFLESVDSVSIDHLFNLNDNILNELHIESLQSNIVNESDNTDYITMDIESIINNEISKNNKLEINRESEIIITENSSNYDIGRKLIQLDQCTPFTNMQEAEFRYNKRKLLSIMKNNIYNNKIQWEFCYAPYFTPIEIDELSGYYSDDVDDECVELFKEYTNYYNGYNNNFNILEWKSILNKLQLKLEQTDSIEEQDYYKQCMITIGWNPEIQFNEITQTQAKSRLESILNEIYKNVSVLDLTSQLEQYDGSDYVQEANKEKLYPISIVLVKGNSLFSNAISKVTKGDFSHSAICIDDNFDKLYSFNADNQLNSGGGFSLESISNYPKENRVSIFTFFVDKLSWEKISSTIQSLLYDIKQTTYSFANILVMPFKNINLNMPESMICSQFVDKMLKLVNVDITNMDSSKVTPNYLYNVSIKNSKIYKTFDGVVKDFNPNKTSKFIDRMSRKAKPINESGILYEYCINQYLYPVVSEARQFPIQFNKDGDAILTNPIIDFDAEYSASHKLLLQYEKSNNIDGMKYELARLYYLNYLLEKKLYSNKYLNNKKKNIKTRARILNDFNKYMKQVLDKEKDFNFSKYYEDSPFYANTVEVKSHTMKHFKKIIDYIL